MIIFNYKYNKMKILYIKNVKKGIIVPKEKIQKKKYLKMKKLK